MAIGTSTITGQPIDPQLRVRVLDHGPALADYLARHLLLDFATPYMDGRARRAA